MYDAQSVNIYKEIMKMECEKHQALPENDSMNFGNEHVSEKEELKINSKHCVCTCPIVERVRAFPFEKDSIVTCCPVCGGKRITNNDIKLLGRVIL